MVQDRVIPEVNQPSTDISPGDILANILINENYFYFLCMKLGVNLHINTWRPSYT